jgi:hypothetical protein
MRLYSVAVASLAIGAPVKWTDNLIAHHRIPDVRSRARGASRGIAWSGVVRIALIRDLHLGLGCGVREAVALADLLLLSPGGTTSAGRWLTVALDRAALEQELQRRLADVLESAPRPRRGRPGSRRGLVSAPDHQG